MKASLSLFGLLFMFLFVGSNLNAQTQQCKPNPSCEKVMECCAAKAKTTAQKANAKDDCCNDCVLPECCKAELVKSGACTAAQVKAIKTANTTAKSGSCAPACKATEAKKEVKKTEKI